LKNKVDGTYKSPFIIYNGFLDYGVKYPLKVEIKEAQQSLIFTSFMNKFTIINDKW
jgi:hypothetical protein